MWNFSKYFNQIASLCIQYSVGGMSPPHVADKLSKSNFCQKLLMDECCHVCFGKLDGITM